MQDTFDETKLITLNSSNGILLNGSYLSNVLFPFVGILKDDISILYTHVDIISAQIPVSFYTVDATNNILNFSINGAQTLTIVITTGNYISSTLLTELQAKFASFSSTITVSFNNNNGKLSLLTTSAYMTLIYYGSTAWRWLGLNNFSTSNIIITLASPYIFPFPLSLVGIKKLKICSKTLATDCVDAFDYTTGDMIQIIPVNAPQFGVINFDAKFPIKTKLKSKRIDSIDIYILDEKNQYVNFNNVEWSITLALTITRPISHLGITQQFSNIPNWNPVTNSNDKNNGTIFTDENDLDFFLWQNGIDV